MCVCVCRGGWGCARPVCVGGGVHAMFVCVVFVCVWCAVCTLCLLCLCVCVWVVCVGGGLCVCGVCVCVVSVLCVCKPCVCGVLCVCVCVGALRVGALPAMMTGHQCQ